MLQHSESARHLHARTSNTLVEDMQTRTKLGTVLMTFRIDQQRDSTGIRVDA